MTDPTTRKTKQVAADLEITALETLVRRKVATWVFEFGKDALWVRPRECKVHGAYYARIEQKGLAQGRYFGGHYNDRQYRLTDDGLRWYKKNCKARWLIFKRALQTIGKANAGITNVKIFCPGGTPR